MTETTADELLVSHTDPSVARPLPVGLAAARRDVADAAATLATIPEAVLARPWPWKGGSEEEIRYGAYRIGEAFERAAIEALADLRGAGVERGLAAELIAPATTARWDLDGLLAGLPDATWDADPGGGEWSIRLVLGHTIASQRAYGIGSGWWLSQRHGANDPDLPAATPEELWGRIPSEESDAEGAPEDVRRRLGDVLDRATERLAGTPAEQLAVGARWSGFAVDVGFRLGRWSSHIREHTIQVEKTLDLLDHRPTETDRLVRLVLAAWGRAESAVSGAPAGPATEAAVRRLATAAAGARATADDIAQTARS